MYKHQKIVCEDCGKEMNMGQKRKFYKCRKCLRVFRKKKVKGGKN